MKKQGTGQAANSMLPFVREDINTGCLHTHKLLKYVEGEWGWRTGWMEDSMEDVIYYFKLLKIFFNVFI